MRDTHQRYWVALGAALSALALSCSGYADLRLPLREQASLRIESAHLFSGAAGRVQVALELPSESVGPAVLIGHPLSATPELSVTAWAWGPCPDGPAPADDAPRLCLAATITPGAPIPPALSLSLIAETRGDGRRFTVFGSGATR